MKPALVMDSPHRSARSGGFTLIELLVALFIFALIAAAGVMLLSGLALLWAALR